MNWDRYLWIFEEVRSSFAATNRWLGVLTNDGSFWDLDYDHIASIEIGSKEMTSTRFKAGAGFAIFGTSFLVGGCQSASLGGTLLRAAMMV